jgi:hypothetical protein
MLKLIYALLALFLLSNINAQTITKSSMPNAGADITYSIFDTSIVSNIDLNPGLNKNWNLSTSKVTFNISQNYNKPDSSLLSIMPTASYELDKTIYELNNTGIYELGEIDFFTGKAVKYAKKNRVTPLHIAQALSIKDTVFISGDTSKTFYITHNVNMGGTLKTKFGTFTNTLVLNSYIISKNNQNVNGVIGKYVVNNYYWFSPNYLGQLMVVGFQGVIDSSGKFIVQDKSLLQQISPKLITATSDLTINSIVTIFPNPAQSNLNISINLPNNENLIIEIVDILGSSVQQKAMNVTQGLQTLNMDINNLNSGGYFLIIKDKSGKIIGNASFIKD